MKSDQRYMKPGRSHGSTWFFVLNIPPDLRGHPRFMTSGVKQATKATESLGTKDPDKARELRDQRLAYWNRQFRMLRYGPSDEDIQEEAVEIFRATLKVEAARPADWGWKPPVDYLRRLDTEIGVHVHKEMRDFLGRTGAVLEPGTEPYRKIGEAFLKAKVAAGGFGAMLPLPDGRWVRADEQHLPPLPQIEPPVAPSEPKPLPPPPRAKDAPETFSEAFERYLATELDGTSEDTIRDYRRKVKVFTDKVGDLPLAKITDHTAVEFLDGYLMGERKQKPMTRNTYAVLFAAVYKCAIRRKKVRDNPFEGQRIKQVTAHYEPFTDQEIGVLFADAKLEVAPAQYDTATVLPWASLIAAYTGCRLEEVASLKVADIKETNGIWYFQFCPDGNGKTKAATRVVPLHHELIDAGLLRYRDALPKESMLFPGLKGKSSKPGKLGPKLGDAFGRWRKRLGIVRPGVNFHSFRHAVGDRLRKAGVAEDDRAAVLGHEDQRITSRVYGHDGPGLYRLRAIVDKINYGAPGFRAR